MATTDLYSQVAYVSDGAATTYSIPFPYFDPKHIHVLDNGTEMFNYEFLSEGVIGLDSPVTEGNTVSIYRYTPRDRLIDFTDGSILNSDTLDRDSNQMMFIVQEATDRMINLITLDVDDAFDVKTKRLKNVADAVEETDAMNMRKAMEYLALTEQAMNTAIQAKNDAQTAQGLSEDARDRAITAETNAETSENNALASELKAKKWADENEDVAVESGLYSAKHHAIKSIQGSVDAQIAQGLAEDAQAGAETAQGLAETAQANAETAETNAVTAKNQAETARASAETAETSAIGAKDRAVLAETNAQTSESNASTSESNALSYMNKADEFANKAEDVEVETSKYSAYHWAMKAQASAGSVVGMSVHDNTWHSEDFETTTGAQAKADSAESNAKSYVDSNLPAGIISMWSGTITTIPSTWALCDGTNGTPDLRDRFVVGAGSSYSVGDTGGADSVTLTEAQLPSHNHGSGTLANSSAGAHTHDSGTLGTNSTGAHTHDSGTLVNNSTGAHTHTWSDTSSSAGSHSHSGSTNTTGSHKHPIASLILGGRNAGVDKILTESISNPLSINFNYSGKYNDYMDDAGNHSHSLSIDSNGSHTHYVSGTTSSSDSHSHTISGSTASAGGHSHSISGNTGSSGGHSHTISGSTASTGSGSSHENRPPFYALAYIMKL